MQTHTFTISRCGSRGEDSTGIWRCFGVKVTPVSARAERFAYAFHVHICMAKMCDENSDQQQASNDLPSPHTNAWDHNIGSYMHFMFI